LVDLVREALAMRRRHGLSWSEVMLAPSAPMLTRACLVEGRLEAGVLPTGQVVGLVEELPGVEELVGRIVSEAEETIRRLSAP